MIAKTESRSKETEPHKGGKILVFWFDCLRATYFSIELSPKIQHLYQVSNLTWLLHLSRAWSIGSPQSQGALHTLIPIIFTLCLFGGVSTRVPHKSSTEATHNLQFSGSTVSHLSKRSMWINIFVKKFAPLYNMTIYPINLATSHH